MLVNRWSFTNAVGMNTATDTVSSAVATLEGNALFDGTGDVTLDGSYGTFVSLPGGLLTNLAAVSFEGWVNASAVQVANNVHLFEFSDETGTGNAYVRYVLDGDANMENFFEAADFAGTSGDPNQGLSGSPGFAGIPVHVVCVFDPVAGVQTIYTNGVLEAMRSFPPNQTTLSNSVSPVGGGLGQSPWFIYSSDPYLTGTISEFRIWSGALNALQVAALDAAGSNVISTNYGTVTSIELEVAYQMTVHAAQQAVVLATATGLAVQPDVALLATYTSGNTNILTVGATGLITAQASGSTTITAIYGSLSNSQIITVSQPVASLSNRWSFYAPSAPAGATTVTDSVQGIVATLQGDAYLDGTNVNLDGTTGTYVSLAPDLLVGIQTLTCEAWLATNSTSPDNVHVYEYSDGNGTGNAYYRYVLHAGGNTINASELADVPNGANQLLQGPPGWGGSGMLQIVTIYDPVAQVQAVFTNGALEMVRTGVTTVFSNNVSTNEASLGRSPWYNYGDPYLNGSISEFRMYSGELTPQQITLNYLAGPHTINTNGPGALESISMPPITMTLLSTQTAPLMANYARLTNFNITANGIFPVAGLTLTSSATNIVSVSANNVLTANNVGEATLSASYQGLTAQTLVTVVYPSHPSNVPYAQLLHRWSFNEPAGSTNVIDSVAGAVGVLKGNAAVNGSGQVTLDGTYGTYISLPGNLLSGVQVLSAEAWLTNAVLPDNTHLFSFDDGVGDGVNGDGYLRYVLKDSSNAHTDYELATTASDIDLKASPGLGGLNVHLVAVYDPVDGQQAIYTNGVLMASQSTSVSLSGVSTNAAALGRSPWWNYGDPWLAGSIDEFRIYSGRLLAADVALTDQLGPNYLLTPPLAAMVNNGSIVFSWPTNYGSPSFTLYSSAVLGASASWSPVTTTPSIIGSSYQISVPATASAAQFFYLKR